MTIIDGIEYDSPYNTTFHKRETDGKIVMRGLKVGDVVDFGDGMGEGCGEILNIDNKLKLIEIDDGSGIETHCRLQYDPVSENKIYATLQKIPN